MQYSKIESGNIYNSATFSPYLNVHTNPDFYYSLYSLAVPTRSESNQRQSAFQIVDYVIHSFQPD